MASFVADLINRVQRLADRVDSSKRQESLDALDEAVQWFANKVPWDGLIKTEVFTTSGSEYLTLPDRVTRVISMADLTNFLPMEAGGNDWNKSPSHMQRASGTAAEWRHQGVVPVIFQPSDPSYISMIASVSESYEVTVKGLMQDTSASGTALEFYEDLEILTIQDESAVTGAKTWSRIDEISKARATNSDLQVSIAHGTVSRIPRWSTRPLYQQLQFVHVPVSGTRLEVQYFRRPDRLTSEQHTIDPLINEDALVWRAAGNLHWMDQEGQQANLAWRKAEEILNDQKNVEETFGEKDHSIQPWSGYFNIEPYDGWD